MQAAPRSTLEVIETKFVFELLMGLLAQPPRLDGRRERLQGRGGWKVPRPATSASPSLPRSRALLRTRDARCVGALRYGLASR
jgi:hypothetical protein